MKPLQQHLCTSVCSPRINVRNVTFCQHIAGRVWVQAGCDRGGCAVPRGSRLSIRQRIACALLARARGGLDSAGVSLGGQNLLHAKGGTLCSGRPGVHGGGMGVARGCEGVLSP